jgi:ABC-type spermidine/putrescine transport system permease subunit II
VALAISGSTALDVLLTASIVVPLVVLAGVILVFFRAARRQDERDRAAAYESRGFDRESP